MQTKRPNKKLSDKFDGPFPITKIISPHVYKLELLHDWTIHPVFHTNFLKPGFDDPLPGQLTTPPTPVFIIDDEGQNTWEVTKILNFKIYRNKFQLLVDWVRDRPDWQLFENVTGAPDALNQYFFTSTLFALVMTSGNDIKTTTLTNSKASRNSAIKRGGTVTVRIQGRTQDSAQLLTKHIDKTY